MFYSIISTGESRNSMVKTNGEDFNKSAKKLAIRSTTEDHH